MFIIYVLKLCNGTETTLVCPIPSFPDDSISARRRRATDDAMIANLTFDFDGYIIDGGTIKYFPDPVYESFSGASKIYESDNKRLEIKVSFRSFLYEIYFLYLYIGLH